eukprot:g31391.t1
MAGASLPRGLACEDVHEFFDFDEGDILGQGGFATVCKAVVKQTKAPRAIKIILKSKVPNEERSQRPVLACANWIPTSSATHL